MLLNNASQPLSWAVPYLLYAAIQFVWIAAFWFPTHFERFRYVPLGKFSYCCFSASVIWMGALFCTFFQKDQDGGCYRCRSPPSDFDFAYQLKKSKLEELPMKEINLRDYYPFYTKDTVVEVPDEVADLLREYKLSEAAHFLRTYRHKAYFSLDYDVNVERDALVIVLSPLDILEQKEDNAALYHALSTLPDKQRERIYAHYILGISQTEIARTEGVSPRNVRHSIACGLKNLKKFFEKF